MHNDRIVTLNKLKKLVKTQAARVRAMALAEEKSGFINPRLDSAICLLKDLLLGIQKIFWQFSSRIWNPWGHWNTCRWKSWPTYIFARQRRPHTTWIQLFTW